MWRARGTLDRMLLGVGTSRGRKSHSRLQVNDVIDFWRVQDLIEDRRLLLRAEMKLPGKAWLEFTIGEEDSMRRLTVIARYDTHTLPGALSWYLFLPFHHIIFVRLIEAIDQRS
jgi:hypothetical protein